MSTYQASSVAGAPASMTSASGSSSRSETALGAGSREGGLGVGGGVDGTPVTPLRPVKSPSGFEFPAIWSFPPFFTLSAAVEFMTGDQRDYRPLARYRVMPSLQSEKALEGTQRLQPNPSTLTHQLEMWRSLVLRWAKHDRIFEVSVDGELGAVFENKGIKRRLLPPSMKKVLQEMVKNGEAAPDPPKQDTRYLLYWRKPDEWGDLIYTWVTENGLNSSIMTFYEVTDGDLSHTTEFYELPPPLLRKALDTLVKRGKAQLLEGKGEIGEGVRFL